MDTDKERSILEGEPLLLLMRKMEKFELLVDRLVSRGLIKRDEVDAAILESTLNHADRQIRMRERVSHPTEELRQAKEVVKKEFDQIEERLRSSV